MEERGQRSNRRLVLVACPYQGHITPMLNLASLLHSKGFSIVIAHTQFNHPHPSGFPNFTFAPIPNCLPKDFLSSGDAAAIFASLNTNCEGPLRQLLSDMMAQDEATESKISCVIYDTLMYCADAAAHYMKLPSMALRTSSIGTQLIFSELPWLRREGYFPPKDHSSKDPVPGAYPLRCKDLPLFNGDPEPMMRVIAMMLDIKTSSAILWNTVDCLEKQLSDQVQKKCHVPFFSLGPLHKVAPASPTSILEEETDCLLWLDKQANNSVIYVSLGSLASMDEREFAETAWGLANSGQPFLWAVRLARSRARNGSSCCRRIQRSHRRYWPCCEMGSTEGCFSTPCRGRLLDPLWMEFNLGKHFRRSPDDMPTVLHGPECERKVLVPRLEGGIGVGG
ncbi:UDP-glucose iridoid glucosyltransferase [Eucalyptus grandis]|uniref:UDP-glucose iridoid glucosyltransferase n=1 Tax=Eucalyptus grandis TaxID=71139 RepID=UPI00192EBAAF|nr:UDP-glucose iridoid glucosyltransferase [Eucalyptus grandis]